jgi:hypothetical protein
MKNFLAVLAIGVALSQGVSAMADTIPNVVGRMNQGLSLLPAQSKGTACLTQAKEDIQSNFQANSEEGWEAVSNAQSCAIEMSHFAIDEAGTNARLFHVIATDLREYSNWLITHITP